MKKLTTYEAYHNGQLIGARESWRVYGHAVIVQDDIERHRALAYGHQPSKSDRSNYDYYTDVAAKQVGEPRGCFGHYIEQEIAEAEAKVAGGWEAFAARVRQLHIVALRRRSPRGGSIPTSRRGPYGSTSRRRRPPASNMSGRATSARPIWSRSSRP